MDGPTGRWFQSVESKLRSSSWLEFCRLLHDRFDRDQKELLIRELFHIRQTTIVPDYITRFTELIDQLSSYSSDTDPMYFTMRFIDGLRPDIKSIVLVMWPQTLDTACTIALLQEEAAGAVVVVIGRLNFVFHHRQRGQPCPCLHHHLTRSGRQCNSISPRHQHLRALSLQRPSSRPSRPIAAHWAYAISAAPSGARSIVARQRCYRQSMLCGIRSHRMILWRILSPTPHRQNN